MSANTMADIELTVTEAARRLQITRQTAVKRIESGLLKARMEGREYRILESELEAYRQRTMIRPENREKD